MKKTKWITLAVAVVALSASLAFAAQDEGFQGGKRGPGQELSRLAEKLNLSDAQKAQLKAIDEGFRENNKAAFESAEALRKEFREAKRTNDTAKLEALKPQMDAQRTQMKQLREAREAQISAILTPEQRTQWEALKAERPERGPHGRHRD